MSSDFDGGNLGCSSTSAGGERGFGGGNLNIGGGVLVPVQLNWCSLLESSVLAVPSKRLTPGPGHEPLDFTAFESGGRRS